MDKHDPSDVTTPVPSWASLLAELEQNPEVSTEELTSLRAAFKILSKHLGEDFLALSQKRAHPLNFSLVHNKAAFPKKRMIWFAGAIQLLSDVPGFSLLRKKLRREIGFAEAHTIVRFSYRFRAARWKIEFEPKMGTSKTPDLLAETPLKHELAIEVSELGESNLDRQIFRGVHAMTGGIAGLSQTHITAGRILFAPDDSDIQKIYDEAKLFSEKLKKSDRFMEISKPGFMELAGAPIRDSDAFTEWVGCRGMKPNQYGSDLPETKDHILCRLVSKLEKEAKQVDGFACPGLIAINCGEFTLQAGLIPERADNLLAWLSENPKILGVVIYGTMGATPSNMLFADHSHIYMEMQGGFFEAERWVFVPNPVSLGSNDGCIRREICEALSGVSLPWDEWALSWS